jgi:hypothetical protein
MDLFGHINNLSYKNKKWEDFTENDRKSFNVYMINKFISMNPDYTDIVNQFQKYTKDLDSSTVFNFYYNFLPKRKTYFKYIKGDKPKINQDIIDIMCLHYECGEKTALEYIDLLTTDKINTILNKYGFDNLTLAPSTKKKNAKKEKNRK